VEELNVKPTQDYDPMWETDDPTTLLFKWP